MDRDSGDRSSMDDRILELVQRACTYPPGHVQRQLLLTQIIRIIHQSKRLWSESTPYYEDALQLTWVFFCQHICEAKSGRVYDPCRGSVVTWLNNYLRWRLRDLKVEKQQQDRHIELLNVPDSSPLWDASRSSPDIPPILEETRQWVESDPFGELKGTHLSRCKAVTCQLLILRRLPPESSWKALSQEFGVTISTLSSFYQRQCLPRLRNFGKSQGYL